MLSSDERDLVLRALRGDQDAFGEIVQLHQQALYRLAYRMLGGAAEAEDAVQEVFLRAYRFLDSFDPDRPMGPWLNRITVNTCMNRLQGRKPVSSMDDERIRAAEDGPERQAEAHDLHRRLLRELDRLPPRYRAVIILRHIQGMTYQQIAGELHRPLGDIKSDLFRARRLLSERLRDLK